MQLSGGSGSGGELHTALGKEWLDCSLYFIAEALTTRLQFQDVSIVGPYSAYR